MAWKQTHSAMAGSGKVVKQPVLSAVGSIQCLLQTSDPPAISVPFCPNEISVATVSPQNISLL